MRVITQRFVDGQLITEPAPWTVNDLKEYIADLRWQAESAGITVGDQFVSTNRDEMPVWQGMLLDQFLRPGQTEIYEYKPRGGENTKLSPAQVARCYECFAWYVAACFATERRLVEMLDGGADPETVYGLIEWPQRNFAWSPA